jgi:hypothetical protein
MTIEDLWQCGQCGEQDEGGVVIVCEDCGELYWQCFECARDDQKLTDSAGEVK